MIRPWVGVLSVLLGLAAWPGLAMAQTRDVTGPTITISAPANGATFNQGQGVTAAYACEDASGVAECSGPVPSGSPLDTSRAGSFSFTVTARDAAGNTSSLTHQYSVTQEVGGSVPAMLRLTLGQAAPFAPFIPGVARDYSTSVPATVLSTAGDATLTVSDASSSHTGHLVNGAFALPQPLKAKGASSVEYAEGFGPTAVGGSASPTRLLTYNGPVSNDVATLTFTQSIGANDALRTGAYTKTLTFTLSTTTP